jgi:hypothetical protein
VASLLAALSLLLILSVPASREVLLLLQTARGVLNLRLASGLFQLNAHAGLLIGGLAALAALIAIVALIEERSLLRSRLLNLHADGIAVLFLGLLTLFALVADNGTGYYGVAKYAFLFAAESTLLVGHIAATALNRCEVPPAKPAFVPLALLLAIFAQQRAAPPDRRDQTLLIEMQQALSKVPPLPLDDRLSGTERLYLFTSPMGQAKDGRALQLLAPNFGEALDVAMASLPPSLIRTVVPQWRGEKIDLDSIPTPSPLIFFGSWGAAGDEGRPAYAPAAHVAVNIASATGALQLCLRVRASPAGARSFVSTFAMNGSEIRTETFEEGDHPRHVGLQLSGRRGDTVLSILNRSETAPAVAGNHGSLTLKAIWLAPTCGRVGVSVDEEPQPRQEAGNGLPCSGQSKRTALGPWGNCFAGETHIAGEPISRGAKRATGQNSRADIILSEAGKPASPQKAKGPGSLQSGHQWDASHARRALTRQVNQCRQLGASIFVPNHDSWSSTRGRRTVRHE